MQEFKATKAKKKNSLEAKLLAISISLDGEIMSFYSRCAKKGLVCIIIIAFSSRQPFFYSKYTKANTCSLCDVRLVSTNKCIF